VVRRSQKLARGRLMLAYTRVAEGASPSRVAFLLSTMTVFLKIAWVNLVAVGGAVAALAPLLGRRRPVGMRTSLEHRPPARVLPFAGRRAQNR
jgi:hypothetical protein